MSTLRIGARLPNSGPLPQALGIPAMARALEQAGFDGLWVADHVVLPRSIDSHYPFAADGKATWPSDAPYVEALIALALAASVTERATLVTAVLVLPLGSPVMFAKQAASIDSASNGRLRLGVGAGWLQEEFDALSVPFADRGPRTAAAFTQAAAALGQIDVLTLAAGIVPPWRGLTGFDAAEWENVMRVNVSGVASSLAHSLITISSWAAQAGSALTQVPAYAASKAAIRNLTQTIARNYAKDGVLAYVVAPGIVRTPMSEISAEARGGIDKVHAALAMAEMVPPQEVAELVAFLATGSCRHLTGATLDMNGASCVR